MATAPIIRTARVQEENFDVRLQIAEDALAAERNNVQAIHYRRGEMVGIPACLLVSRDVSDWLAPAYFGNRTLYFQTLGELGAALLLASDTASYWQRVSIASCSRRMSTPFHRRLWVMEPGLEMLSRLPNLRYLSLDVGAIIVGLWVHPQTALLRQSIYGIVNRIRYALPPHATLDTVAIEGRIVTLDPAGIEVDVEWFGRLLRRAANGRWVVLRR